MLDQSIRYLSRPPTTELYTSHLERIREKPLQSPQSPHRKNVPKGSSKGKPAYRERTRNMSGHVSPMQMPPPSYEAVSTQKVSYAPIKYAEPGTGSQEAITSNHSLGPGGGYYGGSDSACCCFGMYFNDCCEPLEICCSGYCGCDGGGCDCDCGDC